MSDATKAVFLSYASQDAEAAQRICDALRSVGVEVWFDRNELVGGDAWDAKLRAQIGSCALFVPLISANTQARQEGYFRLEWKLAEDRSHLMAKGKPFIVPVSVDGTSERGAIVPDAFTAVQWTKLPGGETSPAFVARVQKLLGGSAAPAVTVTSASPISVSPTTVKRGFPLGIVGALGCVVLILAAFIALRPSGKETPAAPAKSIAETNSAAAVPALATPDAKSIAVLAFANLSAEKDNEYFSDGLSENILDKLARVPGLRVMARTSSFSYKGRNVTAQQIGQELHVGTVIEGSVMRAGNQLRITAQLINAADGMHVWSRQFDRELTTTGIFAMQDDIALEIAGRLSPNSTAAVATGERPTANLEAYDLYLRARDLIVTGSFLENHEPVMKLLDAATRLDPAFALAWGWSGWVGARIFVAGGSGAELLAEPAKRATDEALRLQPDQPIAHLARAWLLYAEVTRLDEMAREIDLAEGGRSPTADTLATRGQELLARARFEAASEAFRRAAELDPKNAATINNYGLTLMYRHRYPEAMAALDQSLKMGGPTISATNKILVALRMGGDAAQIKAIYDSIPTDRKSGKAGEFLSLYLQMSGLDAEALRLAQGTEPAEFLSQWGYFIRAAATARVRETMRDSEGALRDYREALPRADAYRRNHPESWRIYVTLARIYRGLGQKEEALAAARKCLALVPPAKNPYFASRASLRALVNVQARFGQLDEALAIVRDQAQNGFWPRNELLLNPDFFELRKDPRFREIAEKAPL